MKYRSENVLDAARRRMALVFDHFDRVVVSYSGGKDSTAVFWLAVAEAERRGRMIEVFFLDQEAEYAGTVEMVRSVLAHPLVSPLWFQVPLMMTNATSYDHPFLYAWGPGEQWMREKEPCAVHEIGEKYPERFYGFFEWYEQQVTEKTAFLIGLRTSESLNRFRSVTKNAGWRGIHWSTKTKGGFGASAFRFYPIYDWMYPDVWKFIVDSGVKYHPVYDKLFCLRGGRSKDIRISNLIHENAFVCLAELQEVEPQTYDKLCRRLHGVHSAAIYAREGAMYNALELPAGFTSWGAYRDYLLASAPMDDKHRGRLQKRFDGQPKVEEVFRQQARQVLLCDWENNIPVNTRVKSKADVRALWWDKL